MPEPRVGDEDRVDGWADVLARLEASSASVLTANEPSPWTPPAGLGPIPEEMRNRAEGLLATIRASIVDLAAAQRTTARHLAAVRTVPTRGDDQSVYLDISG